MPTPPRSPGAPARRSGAALETAILDAGWAELLETGYARLTMGSVAARARTSEPVLYRRWANKDALVLAVFAHHRAGRPVTVPDTGNLRDDLLQHLADLGESLAGFFAIAAGAAFSGLLASTGLTPAQVREQVMGDELLPRGRAVYQQAAARGEIDLDRVPPAVLALPFDLLRHDLLLDLAPPRPERLLAVVDDVFLPAVQAHST